jgi:tRNA pseudouridine13 synthase
MYILKQIQEDFIVTEITNIKSEKEGNVSYYWLEKKNYNTLDAVKTIARKLNLKEKEIGFAGSKDKQAITKQLISIKRVKKEKVHSLELKDINLTFYGYGNKPISLGELTGNKFKIVIRNLEDYQIEKTNFIENYFDEQRFSKHNVEIGRHLIKKQFKEAAELIDNFKVKEHLTKCQNDYVGAIKKLQIRLLRFYVNAYQSYLWNETLAQYLKNGKKVKYSQGEFVFSKEKLNLKIPLIGFASSISKELQPIIEEIMQKEKLNYLDFVIKQIPELSLEGELRNAFIDVNDLIISKEQEDELNEGKKKVKISFSLGKGSYATMVVRKIIT